MRDGLSGAARDDCVQTEIFNVADSKEASAKLSLGERQGDGPRWCDCLPQTAKDWCSSTQRATRWLQATSYNLHDSDTAADGDEEPCGGACRGQKVFPAFKAFLKSSNAEADEKKFALEEELAKLSKHLEANGPFLKVSAASIPALVLRAPSLAGLRTTASPLTSHELS